MNKLAPFAFGLLLILSGALWFLADGSLNSFIKSKIVVVGEQLTEQTISVDLVDIQTTQGKGEVTNFTILPNAQSANDAIFTASTISFTVALESLETSPMVITEVVVDQAKLAITENHKTEVTNLIATMKENVQEIASQLNAAEHQVEPYVQIKRIVLTNAKTGQIDVKQLTLEPIVDEQGQSMSLAFANILEQSLVALNNYEVIPEK
ncbi:hypothetical protein [Thalassotalea sp. PLHSN55]|uniref:hypothetical protein n=1 Tax=Thalassotalea sp. PLHSN55 TaxID=3435888 RepID=UPI003F8512FE